VIPLTRASLEWATVSAGKELSALSTDDKGTVAGPGPGPGRGASAGPTASELELEADLDEAEALLRKGMVPSPSAPPPKADADADGDGDGEREGGRGGESSVGLGEGASCGEGNSQILSTVEAAVWPRHADDFAFSQAGDDEEEQSSLSVAQSGMAAALLDGDGLGLGSSPALGPAQPPGVGDDDDFIEKELQELTAKGRFSGLMSGWGLGSARKGAEALGGDDAEGLAVDDEDADEEDGNVNCEPEDLDSFSMKVKPPAGCHEGLQRLPPDAIGSS
jgi:hypothetical protein